MRAIVFLILTTLVGCKSEHSAEPFTFQVREIPNDFKLPDEIKKKWDELKITGEPSQLLRIKLSLTEKNHGVLKHPVVDVIFPPGGGELDLAQIVVKDSGTFKLKWLDPNGTDFTSTEIYFIPRYGNSQISDEAWGDPCGNLIKITTFGQKISKDGIDLNATDFRHIRLMGGSFIFLRKTEKALEVAQISITDSRFTEKTCKVS